MGICVALSPYPLSSGDRDRIEEVLGTKPLYRSVTELRRLPLAQMIRTLRPAGAVSCVLALLDGTARPLLPMLHTIASVAGFRRVEAMHADQRLEPLSAWTAPLSAAAVVGATASNAAAIRIAGRELATLLGRDRVDMRLGTSERVLYLSGNLWFGLKAGGSVGHIAGVANGLAAAGYPVDLASMSAPPLLAGDVRPLQLETPMTLGVPFEANGYRFSRAVARQLLPLLAKRKFRFLYERMAAANYAGATLSHATRTPLVLEYNGSEAWIARHWGSSLRYQDLAVAAENACLKHAHLVVTVSDVLRDELLERDVPPERIVWYPNCIDPAIFNPGRFEDADRAWLRRELGLPAGSTVVTFVGTFGQWHGVDVLARAIARLVADDGQWLEANRVRFLLVGDGLKSSEVSAILNADARCERFVSRTGIVPQAEAPAYLATSDIVVSPHIPNPDGSRFFGSPTKLFEYMAMARPIIASDLDQIGAVLQPSLRVHELPSQPPAPGDPHLALLVQPANVSQLVQGIRFLVEHPEWQHVLGANARLRALERYTWRHHVNAILERLEAIFPDNVARERVATTKDSGVPI